MKTLKFDGQGLIPAVIQNALTGKVLMLGYMNEEALSKTQEEGVVWFYSRSRSRLWKKGETSGNELEVVSLAEDCDGDALLILARPKGPTCHTGTESCFESPGVQSVIGTGVSKLVGVIDSRYLNRPEGSYTTYLFDKGLDKILKKVGEEAAEVIIASKNDDKAALVGELSDLLFHSLVLLREKGVTVTEVLEELTKRER